MMVFEENWQQILPNVLSQKIKHWLQDENSFMERLKNYGIVDARIEVLHQTWRPSSLQDSQLLNVELGTTLLVREVLIQNEKHIWMYAKSLFPKAIFTGQYAELQNLKTRALGTVLFNDKNIKRGSFEFIQLNAKMALYQNIKKYFKNPALWTRRSLFEVNNTHLLLTECFTDDTFSL